MTAFSLQNSEMQKQKPSAFFLQNSETKKQKPSEGEILKEKRASKRLRKLGVYSYPHFIPAIKTHWVLPFGRYNSLLMV
jgi:hypothetical protein